MLIEFIQSLVDMILRIGTNLVFFLITFFIIKVILSRMGKSVNVFYIGVMAFGISFISTMLISLVRNMV